MAFLTSPHGTASTDLGAFELNGTTCSVSVTIVGDFFPDNRGCYGYIEVMRGERSIGTLEFSNDSQNNPGLGAWEVEYNFEQKSAAFCDSIL